jgi:hypothetical protein
MQGKTINQACQQLHAGFKSAVKELMTKLCSLGYAARTVSFYEQGAVHFSFSLARRRISPSQLKQSHFADFLSRHAPYVTARSGNCADAPAACVPLPCAR